MVQAPAPERPIDGGMAREALVAHVVVGKFCDSLPLFRSTARRRCPRARASHWTVRPPPSQGRLWSGPTQPAAYVYSEDRKGEHPTAHLAAFNGILQVDGGACAWAGLLSDPRAGFSSLVEARKEGCCNSLSREAGEGRGGGPVLRPLPYHRDLFAPQLHRQFVERLADAVQHLIHLSLADDQRRAEA